MEMNLGGKIPEKASTNGEPKSVVEETVSASTSGKAIFARGAAAEGQEDEEEIIESDVELEGDIVEPDNDPPQKMGDPSRKINVDMRIAAQIAKGQAMTAMSEGNLAGAANSLTMAIVAYPISANMYATRASVYIKMKKPNAAIRDADAALEINPDHAKGYKYRGIARAMLGQWEAAAKDLHLASNLDYDEEISSVLKKVEPNARKIQDHRRKYERLYKERENRKIKRERQQLRAEAQAALENAKEKLWQIRYPEGMSIGIGWDSIGGGIPDIDLTNIVGDPSLAAELQEPGVLAAIQNVIRNPANLAKYDEYPKVAVVIVKLFGGN